MKSIRNLRLRLRLLEGALLLLLAIGTTAAVSTYQLLLDAANHPTSDFSLTSTHLIDTLDDARLSANVPLLNAGSNVFTGDLYTADLYVGNNEIIDFNGNVYAVGNLYAGNCLVADNSGNVNATYLTVSGTLSSDNDGINSDGLGDLTLSGGITVGQYGYSFSNGADLYPDGNPGSSTGLVLSGAGTYYLTIGGGIGAYGVTPPATQPAAIANPTGGTTVDIQARAAIDAINAVLKGSGWTQR